MEAIDFDYIRKVNSLSEELLREHGELLEKKKICSKRELIRVIKWDLDKLAQALLEVKEGGAAAVLQDFFVHSDINHSEIRGKLTDESIYHLGFEIHEPLDLVLYGINHWIEHSRRALGAKMRIRNFLRFPASQAFQERVGAFTEIMRIWIETGERVLMLELFDIYRPTDSVPASAPTARHRNFTSLFRPPGSGDGNVQGLTRLFGPDEIWHYALHVRLPADVVEIHQQLKGLQAQSPHYVLPYDVPVHNPHDDSFHTKIVRRQGTAGGRLEIEFVTKFARA